MSWFTVRSACHDDLDGIRAVLIANATEPSIRERPVKELSRQLSEFRVAHDDSGQLIGCAATEPVRRVAELCSVAVLPDRRGAGIGSALVGSCLSQARSAGFRSLWLATTQPAYFGRFGFRTLPYYRAPIALSTKKLALMLRRPRGNWNRVASGEMVLMRLEL